MNCNPIFTSDYHNIIRLVSVIHFDMYNVCQLLLYIAYKLFSLEPGALAINLAIQIGIK